MPKFLKSCPKINHSSLILNVFPFHFSPKNSTCIWATFGRIHVTQDFHKSPNLVTLVGNLSFTFLSYNSIVFTFLPSCVRLKVKKFWKWAIPGLFFVYFRSFQPSVPNNTEDFSGIQTQTIGEGGKYDDHLITHPQLFKHKSLLHLGVHAQSLSTSTAR